MARRNGREMCPPSEISGVDTIAHSDGRRAEISERINSSGAFWAQVLKLCRETRIPGLLPSGVLCLLLYEDVDLSMDEVALATGFNKGHISRKIRQTRRILRSMVVAQRSSNDETYSGEDLVNVIAELAPAPPSDFRPLTETQWRRIDDLIAQNPSGQRPYDRRKAANAIMWKTVTGKPWRELPVEFGNRRWANSRSRQWQENGTLRSICDALGFSDR